MEKFMVVLNSRSEKSSDTFVTTNFINILYYSSVGNVKN